VTAVLLLAAAGFVLLLTEMFLPGGVLGALGGLALLGAVILGYVEFGSVIGTAIFGAISVVVLIGFCVWMAVFPSTTVGRRLTLGRTLPAGPKLPDASALVGAEGIAITPLRPAGTARIGERRVDVVAEGAFVASGESIVVLLAEGARVVVRKKG
jgi:membrane-bound serine protease (ClpP class)